MLRSHGNTSRAAQFFSLWILWEAILPGPAASLAAQSGGPGMGQQGGLGVGQLKLRNAGLESELLRNHFSHPAPVRLPLGFSWRAVEDLGSR